MRDYAGFGGHVGGMAAYPSSFAGGASGGSGSYGSGGAAPPFGHMASYQSQAMTAPHGGHMGYEDHGSAYGYEGRACSTPNDIEDSRDSGELIRRLLSAINLKK